EYFYEMPTTGLVSWWKFDGDADDGWGDNDGEVYGAALRCASSDSSYTPSEHGCSYEFDGNDYIVKSTTTNLNIVGDVTFAAWVKTDALYPSNYGFIFQGDNPDSYFALSDGQVLLSLSIGGVRRAMVGNYPISIGDWHHVVGTWDGSMMRIYVDGEERNSAGPYSGILAVSNGGVMNIGKYSLAGAYYFDGFLDDVMVYNKALSGNEVTAIYENQRSDY
ncbi:MAG: LamG domain-containing protein, partial [Nanoarchaeota archaeon]|nr:LamG domain-containing protein [Nanoarchaeota archaeon]